MGEGSFKPRCPVCRADEESTAGEPFRGGREISRHIARQALSGEGAHRAWVKNFAPGLLDRSFAVPAVANEIQGFVEMLVRHQAEAQARLRHIEDSGPS